MTRSFSRRLVRQGAAILVLLALLVVGRLTAPERRTATRTFPAFPGLEEAGIAAIRFGSDEKLMRRPTGWEIVAGGVGVPARGERVQALIEALRKTTVLRSAASDEGAEERFGFDGLESRLTIEDAGGDEIASITVGGADSSTSGYFARLAGEPRIVVVDGGISPYLSRDRAYWSDRRVFVEEITAAEIIAVAARDGEVSVDLVRERSGGADRWVDRERPDAFFAAGDVDAYIRRLLSLEATAIEPGVAPVEGESLLAVTLRDEASRVYSLLIVPAGAGDGFSLVRGEGARGAYTFALTEEMRDRVIEIPAATPRP